MPERRIHAWRRESARYHTRRWKIWRPLHSTTTNRTFDLVTALCSQPEAFTSDLGDDESRYVFADMQVVICETV